MAEMVAVVLAAGDASRLRTAVLKALHRVGGKALIDYALEALAALKPAATAVVGPADPTALSEALADRALVVPGAASAGMGLQRALAQLPQAATVLVLPCDLPQLTAEQLQALLGFQKQATAATLVVGGVPTGVYAVPWAQAMAVDPDAPAEALFPQAQACPVDDQPLIDVNTRAELARADKAVRRAIAERLMDAGVTILDPDNTYIDATVQVGQDTIIYPWTVIEGETQIGCGCTVGPHAHLMSCRIGDAVTIESAVIRESAIGRGVRVGPFANMRPGCQVDEGAKVGDFVELKNSHIGARTAVAHLAYIGDADIGAHVNIGAGVITCNYDGVHKHRTVVGDNAFIGSNSVLIAPVEVGAGAYVAAHSAINVEVPADALGIARSRQENKEDWARRRRKAQGKE